MLYLQEDAVRDESRSLGKPEKAEQQTRDESFEVTIQIPHSQNRLFEA